MLYLIDNANLMCRYVESRSKAGDDMDYNTSLFQGAALCAACKYIQLSVYVGP